MKRSATKNLLKLINHKLKFPQENILITANTIKIRINIKGLSLKSIIITVSDSSARNIDIFTLALLSRYLPEVRNLTFTKILKCVNHI